MEQLLQAVLFLCFTFKFLIKWNIVDKIKLIWYNKLDSNEFNRS